MNSDRVNAKQQRLHEVQKTLLTVCTSTAKLGIITEDSAAALETLANHWLYIKNDLDLTVEMMKKNEGRRK